MKVSKKKDNNFKAQRVLREYNKMKGSRQHKKMGIRVAEPVSNNLAVVVPLASVVAIAFYSAVTSLFSTEEEPAIFSGRSFLRDGWSRNYNNLINFRIRAISND